jgi:glyoxylate carboligase
MLLQAERPLIYAGGGVTRAGASAELIALAEVLQAPVVNTCVGKGSIPGDHPLALGHLMMTPPVRALIERVDVMLAIGTRFTPRATAGWSLKMPHQLIQIDLDPTQFGKNYAAELCLLGDAKAVLQQVLEFQIVIQRDVVRFLSQHSLTGHRLRLRGGLFQGIERIRPAAQLTFQSDLHGLVNVLPYEGKEQPAQQQPG